MGASSTSESERCGLCPQCGGRCRIKKTRAGEELRVECRDKKCAQNGQRPATGKTPDVTRIWPQNVGSYVPEASWADKFRTHPNVSRVIQA